MILAYHPGLQPLLLPEGGGLEPTFEFTPNHTDGKAFETLIINYKITLITR